MDVKQVAAFVNEATKEALGAEAIQTEDLTNIVEMGTAIFNANAMDKYVNALVNHIGKVVFVDRAYAGSLPSIMRDGWEFGSVLEKITIELPEADANDDWQLTDGSVYEQQKFIKPVVSAKFFNKLVTMEVPMSIAERQVKQSFSSATQMNSFVSAIYTAIENSLTIKTDELIRRAIDNMIGETLFDEYSTGAYTASSGVRAVNLLKLYNDAYSKTLTKAVAVKDPEFLRFASFTIAMYKDKIKSMSKIFNIGGKARFTPADKLHLVLLSEFAEAQSVYLQSDTYNKELVALPNYEKINYWQGSGTEYAIADTSKIDTTTSAGNAVSCDYIVGVMFDHDAVAVCLENRRTNSAYNAKGDFTNLWYKADMELLNDNNENFVVFFLA